MRRLSRSDLEALVFVAIATAPPGIKRGLKSKLPQEVDQARGELTQMICNKLDNDSYMVIVTELVGQAPYQKLGRWGVDEPVPATPPQLGK